jgi:hypothetical protein
MIDVAELMRSARRSFDSLHIEGHEWRHHERLHDAFMRGVRPGATLAFATGPGADPESDEPWRVWIDARGRMRVEFFVGAELVTAVIDGDTWWSWSPSRGGQTNGGRTNYTHGTGPSEALVNPGELPAALDLGEPKPAEHLGRPAYAVIATPVAPPEFGPPSMAQHSIGSGATDYELVVDAATGLVLRSEARLNGNPFRVIEATTLEIDTPLDDTLFTLEPNPT